jgi:hypothetical protein
MAGETTAFGHTIFETALSGIFIPRLVGNEVVPSVSID